MTEVVSLGQQEIQRYTEGELPEAKLFDLMSSFNGEHHALDLIVMKPGVIYGKADHYQEVMSHQAEGRGWRISRDLPFVHCEDSLSKIGLVTREALSPDGTAWGYEITQYGIETGVPFGGALLKWSYEHPELSLYKMMTTANSTSIKDEQTLEKKRAQEARYKIFWEIATNPSNRIRLKDIAEGMNEGYGIIGGHLLSLRRNGVISYKVTDRGKSYSAFRRKEIIPDRGPEPHKENKTLSTRIFNFLTQSFIQTPDKYLSTEEITNALIKEYPEYESIDRKNLGGRIAVCLTNFEKQGYIDREKFGQGFQSEITLSEQQRETIVSFVTLLDNFKNGDRQTLDEGRIFAQRVLNDSNLFSELMLKAKEASPAANRTSREEMELWLISILQKYPNSTVSQIQQALERDYHKKLARDPLGHYLYRLGQGTNPRVTYEETKSGYIYRTIENLDNQAAPPRN